MPVDLPGDDPPPTELTEAGERRAEAAERRSEANERRTEAGERRTEAGERQSEMVDLAAALARTGADIATALAVQADVAVELAAEKRTTRRQFRAVMALVAGAALVLASVLVRSDRIQAEDADRRARAQTEAADRRVQLSRDRQRCAEDLDRAWNVAVGEVLKKATEIPRTPRTSDEYQATVARLNEATDLLNRTPELCDGPNPNPNPVPG